MSIKICIDNSLPESRLTGHAFTQGYIFPALIAALVPFRTFVVRRMFDEDDLVYLDPMEEAFATSDEEENDFVKEFHLSHAINASDIEDAALPHGFAEYRGQHPDPHKNS